MFRFLKKYKSLPDLRDDLPIPLSETITYLGVHPGRIWFVVVQTDYQKTYLITDLKALFQKLSKYRKLVQWSIRYQTIIQSSGVVCPVWYQDEWTTMSITNFLDSPGFHSEIEVHQLLQRIDDEFNFPRGLSSDDRLIFIPKQIIGPEISVQILSNGKIQNRICSRKDILEAVQHIEDLRTSPVGQLPDSYFGIEVDSRRRFVRWKSENQQIGCSSIEEVYSLL